MKKTILYWEKFRSNDCRFQLKIMGIVFRHGIPDNRGGSIGLDEYPCMGQDPLHGEVRAARCVLGHPPTRTGWLFIS
jgi:hypothetical protein